MADGPTLSGATGDERHHASSACSAPRRASARRPARDRAAGSRRSMSTTSRRGRRWTCWPSSNSRRRPNEGRARRRAMTCQRRSAPLCWRRRARTSPSGSIPRSSSSALERRPTISIPALANDEASSRVAQLVFTSLMDLGDDLQADTQARRAPRQPGPAVPTSRTSGAACASTTGTS